MLKDPFRNFAYLWRAEFSDGHIVTQDPDDRYSRHNSKAEWNPSSFRDFIDYAEEHPDARLEKFCLFGAEKTYTVIFKDRPVIMYDETNRYGVQTKHYEWYKCKRELTNLRPIYYRHMSLDMLTGKKELMYYVIGFQGNEANGSNFKKELKVV